KLGDATSGGTVRAEPTHDTRRPQPLPVDRDASSQGESSGAGALTPDQIRAAALQLAGYLEPIAHLVAKREAARATDLPTLLARLADAISNDADRARFRRVTGSRTE